MPIDLVGVPCLGEAALPADVRELALLAVAEKEVDELRAL